MKASIWRHRFNTRIGQPYIAFFFFLFLFSFLLLPHHLLIIISILLASFPYFRCGRCLLWMPQFKPVVQFLPGSRLPDKSFRVIHHHIQFGLPLLNFPRHLHPRPSFTNILFFSSQHKPISLQHTFLHYIGYFSHLRFPSVSFTHYSVQIGDSTQPS